MTLAVIYSRGRSGIEAPLVTVEVHVANGLPAMNIVGLPETAVKESKDRVRGAILNSRFEFRTRDGVCYTNPNKFSLLPSPKGEG
jgi:magnesium chelatase family protein